MLKARTAVYETTFDGNDVVMKFGLDQERQDALMREAVLYREKLRDLQGTGIPMFYGYYFGLLNEDFYEYQGRKMGCIVLENCGERLPSFMCMTKGMIIYLSQLFYILYFAN